MLMHDLSCYLQLWKFFVPMVSCDDEYCNFSLFVQRLDLFVLSKCRTKSWLLHQRAYNLGEELGIDRGGGLL